jgi:AraC-like DNA-binding protein
MNNIRFKILAPESGRTRGSDHPAVSQSLDFIARNFSRGIKLIDVIASSGMSRRGLLGAFNQHLGCSPGALIRQARLEHARRLLTEYDLPLKTIAKRCGYRSENTFCVAFSREAGMSPKKFQRQVWLAVSRHSRLTKNISKNWKSAEPAGRF